MKKLTRLFAILALTLLLATPAIAQNYWDGYFENTLIKGNLQLRDGAKITGLSLKIASIVMTGVDYTLSAAEALCNILVVKGSPSGQAIIAPTISASGVSRLYTVRNEGGDSGDVIIKKTAGTGVTIGTGKTAKVFWSGSDYVRETADATH
jgi:hypothetical protein